MGKYNSFANLLKDQATHDNLPDMLFTDNADLRGSTARLAIASSYDDEVSAENIVDVIKEFDSFNEDAEYNGMFSSFENIAQAFASKLQNGVDTLRAIKEDVTWIKDKHDETVAMRIAENPVLAKICGIEKELTMENAAWNYLDEVDERFLITELHDKIGMDPDREINKSVISLVINAMPCANRTNQVELKAIEIGADKFNASVDKLAEFVQGESKETVAGMFANLLKLDTYSCELAVRSATNFANGKTLSKLNDILHISVAYNKLFDAIKRVDLDIATSTLEEIGTHVDAMHAISSTMLYIASYYRNTIWKDSVLLPGPYVNTDNLSAFENEGGTITNIVHHYNRFFKDIAVPSNGITGKFIMQSAERLEKEFSDEATKNIAIINSEKKNIERGCFIVASVEYLRGQKLSPKFPNSLNLDKYAASVFDSMPEAPIESRFYKLIINSIHPNTITSMLYDRLSKEYTSYAAKTGKLTKETCAELDEKVYSDMICEYLVNQGVVIV
ncbi:MAG: hypothetical protein IKA36_05165 [Clostridia bacterium]|nr:hypothetical protein [Clostridia bacterium]